jgi:hypothetical protein
MFAASEKGISRAWPDRTALDGLAAYFIWIVDP